MQDPLQIFGMAGTQKLCIWNHQDIPSVEQNLAEKEAEEQWNLRRK